MIHKLGTAVASLAFAATTFGITGAASAAELTEETTPVTSTGTIKILDRGGDSNSGWVEYTGTGTVVVDDTTGARGARASAGGGTWYYGVGPFGNCYSDYKHPSKYHSATAISDISEDKDQAPAGSWAKAKVNDVGTCRAFWGTSG